MPWCAGVSVQSCRWAQCPLAPSANGVPALELGDRERGMWGELLAGLKGCSVCAGVLHRKVSQV